MDATYDAIITSAPSNYSTIPDTRAYIIRQNLTPQTFISTSDQQSSHRQ